MYSIASLSRYRVFLAIAALAAILLAFMPAGFTHATDPFGIDAAQPSRLGDTDLIVTITNIINVALGLLGIIAVVIILVAGFQWMTAGGNEEKVTEARARITQGVIGLAIILSAYAIANFVVNRLAEATDAPP